MTSGGRSVLIAGGTGLVGRKVLLHLAGDARFSRLVVLSRRPLTISSDPRLDLKVGSFRGLDRYSAGFPVDAVICAIGTTLRKAGSREEFRRVDFDYPVRLAELAAREGADRFVLVSSLGADPNSRFFYPRIKGETEVAVRETGVAGLVILRPSLLLGHRDEFRLGEGIMKALSPILPATWRGITATRVARVMVEYAARAGHPGECEILESERIRLKAAG